MNIGDKVKVKESTMCPDLKGLNIGGWQGIITGVTKDDFEGKPLVCIKWDDTTLNNMPSYFIEQGEEEDLDNNLMYLSPDDIEVVE